MTRNEWIAETAARLAASRPSDTDALIVGCAVDLAECLESRGYAPWQTPAPPLTDAAAKVVEEACAYIDRYATSMVGEGEQPLVSAVRAYRESVK